MSNRTKIYVASPLGFSEAGRYFMYDKLIPAIKEWGFEVIDPWKLTDSKLLVQVDAMPCGDEKKEAWRKLDMKIAENNTRALKQVDGLVAVLDGTDVDSGTSAEIGYAAALGKKILGYRGDFRFASDNEGCIVNLQVEYFIRMHGGNIVTKIDDLGKELMKVFR